MNAEMMMSTTITTGESSKDIILIGGDHNHSNVDRYQVSTIGSPPPMLPDEHWNEIELLSFGLNGTRINDDHPYLNHQLQHRQMHVERTNVEPNPIIMSTNTISIIHYAASNNHLDLMLKLIVHDRINVDTLDQEHNTPLLVAASFGLAEMIKLLLEHGANVNARNQFDNTALHEAAWRGFSQSVDILCRFKAKLHLKNKQGHTALHLSAQKGHNQCCRTVLLAGCKPNIKNNFGDTPLHSASRYGHVGVVRILISAFANVNELNKNDDTSLHIAAAMGRKKLIKILLESGCNPTIANKQGETPMNIALRKSFLEIQELIANPPPLKPIYLKQQELYDRPMQGSYKDIYCSVVGTKSDLDSQVIYDQSPANYGRIGDKIKLSSQNRRSRACKSDFSNGHSIAIEKQSSSISKYYNTMLRKFGGGTSPLDHGNDDQHQHQHHHHLNEPLLTTTTELNDTYQQLGRQCGRRSSSSSNNQRNREFPKPKLETLPTEPLAKGEQYYVDLSGHIHKGRIAPGPDMEPLINHRHYKTTRTRSKS
ncbi:Ankyrin repeat domain-containing protein 6 [Blomia tropicalis]|nr:Ankyrin repeat domain-containing protein 6 [Blomia tropicalis]